MSKERNSLAKNLEQETLKTYEMLINDDCENSIKLSKNNLLEKWKTLYNTSKEEAEGPDYKTELFTKHFENSNLTIESLLVLHLLINNETETLNIFLTEIGENENINHIIYLYNYKMNIQKCFKEENYDPLNNFIDLNLDFFITNPKLKFYCCVSGYLKLLLENKKIEATSYFYNSFRPIKSFKEYENELKKLISILIFPESADLYLTLNKYKRKILKQFKLDFLQIYGIPGSDHFSKLFLAGTDATEILKNRLDIVNENLLSIMDLKEEMPFDLPVKTRYHSIFICPVLKKFCDENNPPVMLPCGHVISNEAVLKISRNKEMVTFKCPYCPMACYISKIKKLEL